MKDPKSPKVCDLIVLLPPLLNSYNEKDIDSVKEFIKTKYIPLVKSIKHDQNVSCEICKISKDIKLQRL